MSQPAGPESVPAQDAATGITAVCGVTVLLAAANGPPVNSEQGALDLLGESWQSGADLLAVPVERFDSRFFDLGSGLAGAVLQKFVNYRLQVAIVGDITEQLAGSAALRAFVAESNRGRHVWFAPDMAQLADRISRGRVGSGTAPLGEAPLG